MLLLQDEKWDTRVYSYSLTSFKAQKSLFAFSNPLNPHLSCMTEVDLMGEINRVAKLFTWVHLVRLLYGELALFCALSVSFYKITDALSHTSLLLFTRLCELPQTPFKMQYCSVLTVEEKSALLA